MGTLTATATHRRGGYKEESRGGVRLESIYVVTAGAATYATSGDTLPTPTVPTGWTLLSIELVWWDKAAGITIKWNGNTSTPKLIAFDEDNTSGIEAELANGNAQLNGLAMHFRYNYRIGA